MGVWWRLERVGPPWVEWAVGGWGWVEQLCLEVAPSILIDFICAHVSESERHGAARRRKSREVFKGARGGRAGASERERMKERRWERKRKEE